MKSRKSAKDFNTGWDGNNYCSGCEVSSRVYVHPDCKHVVGSDDKPQEANGHHGSDYSHVAERFFFASVVGDNV